jgi:predicted nucleic acid-binding protein
MIVVDTNAIAYLLIPGQRSPQAKEMLKKDAEWLAPLLWRSEFSNVLALYLRQKHLELGQALRIMQEAELLMRGGEYKSNASQVLSLVATSTCSAYDCEFVALAQDLGLPLVTSDKKLLKEFPGNTISMDDFIRQQA